MLSFYWDRKKEFRCKKAQEPRIVWILTGPCEKKHFLGRKPL